MLQLVLGQSGSGKSFEIRRLISECDQENIILLVPEQGSFDAEKTVCNLLDPSVRRRVEVLTFSRLCDNVFRKYGSVAGERINDSGKSMLMSVALDTVKDELKIYKNYHRHPEFIQRMAGVAEEFKNAGLTPERLENICDGHSGTRVEKLLELSKIYAVYSYVLDSQGVDTRDDILRATKLVMENGFFEGKAVFIDGFKDFTGAQAELVKYIIKQSDSLTVSVCTDALECDSVIFTSSNSTARFLMREAKEAGVDIKTPITLNGTKRSENELAAVAENFLRKDVQSYEEDCENVTLYYAQNPRDEAEYIAASICDLVKNKGYRYRDMAVVGRNVGDYSSLLNEAFLRYGIPVYNDERTEIISKPLIKLLTAFITASRSKNDIDSVFTILKSPFSPFDYEKVCEFENYCFIWNLSGLSLREPLKNHPDGLGAAFDERSTKKLADFEEIRRIVISSIDDFGKATKNCDGLTFAQEVYKFLVDFGVGDKISEGNNDEDVEVFNCTMTALEQMATVLKGMEFDIERMEALFKVAILDSDYGKIPQHLDELLVGSANRIRYNSPKVVFVFGAVDGSFPAIIRNDAIVGWEERAFLRKQGVEIPDNEKGLYADERYFAYMAVSAPSEKLVVSFPIADLSGNKCYPSLIVLQIEAILPKVKKLTAGTVDRTLFLQTRESVLHEYAERFYENKELAEAVKETDDGTVATLVGMAKNKELSLSDPKLAAALFGKHITVNPTKVENFYECPFSYFCEKGLRVSPLRKIEMDPMQSGTFIHHCLYELLCNRSKEDFIKLSEKEINALCDSIAADYLKNVLIAEDYSDKRFITLMMRLKNTVRRLAIRLQKEFEECDFVPTEFEVGISRGADITPLKIDLPDGSSISIEGKVDRIDVLEQDGEKYVRVVDYKSGSKNFRCGDIDYGLNMQMLLYLFAVCDENAGKYAGAKPAGVLYMPVGDSYAKEKDDKKRQEELLEHHKMKGLVLDDLKIVRAMENSGEGKFIPANITVGKTKKAEEKVSSRSKSLISAEGFEEIKEIIAQHICDMGTALIEGSVSPKPTECSGYKVCEYCNYASICKQAQQEEEE